LAIRQIIYKDNLFKISYEILNNGKERDIIFLHGWGSSKLLMKNVFEKSFKDFRHIYIDLVGFGESENPAFPLSTKDYKDILEILFKELKIYKNTIIGHSFGGKVATLLNPEHLVLLSSAGIPTQKSFEVKIKIALFKIFKKIGLSFLKNIFVSRDGKNLSKTMYETFKNVVDEDFKENFSKRDLKTTIFWGKDDLATPLTSGETIHSLIKNSRFYPLSGDHFFFINHKELIENILIK
jgi:pimeloyl-ACP methyl ester carboxylesterase